MLFSTSGRGFKLALALTAALSIAACSKNPDDANGANGAGGLGGVGSGVATPGSQQDFVVNVGDRVFFETDSSELTSTAQATLDKQARWLQQYSRYSFTVEGHADERQRDKPRRPAPASRSPPQGPRHRDGGISAWRLQHPWVPRLLFLVYIL